MGKFVISDTKNGGYHFVLKAGNGEIIASGETYSSLDACKNGVASVRKNCGAAVEDQTVKSEESVKNPKFEIYQDKRGDFRFRLKAANGEIIATGEGYTAKSSCKNGIESVKKNAPDSELFVTE
ncbi:MAG: YegP family protein [Oscillospiraceae bacterium]